MAKQYSCELCKKVFNQKIDYVRHQNKKSPCISLVEIQRMAQTNENKKNAKKELINIFKQCLNTLRDNEGLTGEKALRTLSQLLILKLIEPHIDGEINFETYDFDFSHIEDDCVETYKKRLFHLSKFSNLALEKEDNLVTIMSRLWEDILARHPSTKNIFSKDKRFEIRYQSTYKKMIDKINNINLNNEYDVLGGAYEEVVKDIMIGKVLGQFFTQPLVKKMMVEMINPQVHADGKIDTCADPTMGTGGFLITYLQHIMKQANAKGIGLDWNYIKTQGLYGKDIEPDTYQLAVSNMLISSGHMFEHLECGDSIRQPIIRKFDNILANPPFGIKGLKYDEIIHELKTEYLPIRCDNAVSLFIQAIIYMLKIGGKCAIVLPDGQDLFSKTNNSLVAVREYLLKTCDLKEVVHLPSGLFDYTSIKTCVFYFVKKREGCDVLEIKDKLTKTQKMTGREYKFTKTHQTHNVKFYDTRIIKNENDEEILEKKMLVEVPIEKLAQNSYALNYAEYMENEDEEEYNDEIVVKTLGEVCEFLPKSKRQASYGEKDGLYPFFTSSQNCNKYCNEYDYKDECIIIGTGGSANIKYGCKFSCSADNIVLKPNYSILIKYIYYYLYNNINLLQDGFIGSGLKHISKDYISNIKIPIPPFERQQEIVDYLDFIYEKANKTSNDKIAELKQLNQFCLNNQMKFGNNVVKTLGEVCNFKNGKGIKKDALIEGEYPVIGGGQKPLGFHNEYNCNENTILCSSSGAYAGFISKYNKKVWASDCFTIIPKNNLIDNTYLYNLLKSQQDIIYKTQTGVAQPHVYSKDLQKLKISIPPLERQQEIVAYCEHNDALIKQLENEIENNKSQAKMFLSSIIQYKCEPAEENTMHTTNINNINDDFNTEEEDNVPPAYQQNDDIHPIVPIENMPPEETPIPHVAPILRRIKSAKKNA